VLSGFQSGKLLSSPLGGEVENGPMPASQRRHSTAPTGSGQGSFFLGRSSSARTDGSPAKDPTAVLELLLVCSLGSGGERWTELRSRGLDRHPACHVPGVMMRPVKDTESVPAHERAGSPCWGELRGT
jgi:hypothetical protein